VMKLCPPIRLSTSWVIQNLLPLLYHQANPAKSLHLRNVQPLNQLSATLLV
jgi:hypothetical protein